MAEDQSKSFRTLRARVTFVLSKVTKTAAAGASRHGCAAPVPCASRPPRHAAPTRFAQTRGSSAAWPTCDARLASGANSESESNSESNSKSKSNSKSNSKSKSKSNGNGNGKSKNKNKSESCSDYDAGVS